MPLGELAKLLIASVDAAATFSSFKSKKRNCHELLSAKFLLFAN